MSFSNFSDNDDDLFSESSSQSENSKSNFFTDQIKNILDSNDVDNAIDPNLLKNIFLRARMANSLYDTSNDFIFSNTSYNRTVFNTFNFLTDNRFQYDLLADVLEESITRRVVVLDLVNTIVTQANSTVLEAITNSFGIELNSSYLNTYFNSFISVMEFVIEDNINLYKSICDKINRPCLQALLDKDVEHFQNLIYSDVYINNVFDNIRKDLGFYYEKQ